MILHRNMGVLLRIHTTEAAAEQDPIPLPIAKPTTQKGEKKGRNAAAGAPFNHAVRRPHP
jgi:hypothetical protein